MVLCVVVAGSACARSAPEPPPVAPVAIAAPTGPDGGIYSLTADGRGGALLSWLEPSSAGLALRFSSLQANHQWSAPTTIVEGTHLFSNWADHPSVAAGPDGTLIAQWPVINEGPRPPGSYNNSLRIAMSQDGGASWTERFADGLDNIHSYTGFASLLPGAAGTHAVYLSPPRPISHDPADHRMTLSHVAFDPHGQHTANGVVDSDTCSCCPTSTALTAAGPIAAYRDHQPGEIRDIAVVRLVDDAWTPPVPVHQDGWVINGCPTNGPSIGASGSRVAVTWFTAAAGTPRLRVAFSTDNGATFAAPIEVDGADAVGRPSLLLLADGSAVVVWLATKPASSDGELRIRRIRPDGAMSPTAVVGSASPGRVSGMPKMVHLNDALLVAWRGDAEQIQTVRLAAPHLPPG